MRALAAALLLAGSASAAPVKLPDGRRIELTCAGRGSPAVIFEAGFMAWSFAWAAVQPAIARRHRACSYDRAGLGASDPAPSPRDGAAIAADLTAALAAAKVAPPYILVGHSSGGLYARVFADRFPGQVAGMVLVDPSVEPQFAGGEADAAEQVARMRRCAAAAAAKALPSPDPALALCTPRPASDAFGAQVAALALMPGYWETLASEYEQLGLRTVDQLRAGRQRYGDLPLIVLTAGGTGAPTPESQARLARWSDWHDALAARSSRGENRIVPNTGHLIMREQPQAVIDAVDQVAAQIR